jgi:epoxyqueuosine reductase
MNILAAEAIREKALGLGFNLVGLCRATPSPTLDAYLRWVEGGLHGQMGYMGRPDRIERRQDLSVIVPGAQSLIMVGLDYHGLHLPEAALADPSRGRIAAYAWGMDYHDVMTPQLTALAQWLAEQGGTRLQHSRAYVDTGPILERSHAQQAGLGFIGKNTMLIHPQRGSYFFLGEILTTLTLDAYDSDVAKSAKATMCGTCRRCLDACPTDAFPMPHILDARRCISYLTIEHKGWIDPVLRPLMGNWVLGCDICQDVCPFNRFSKPADHLAFPPASLEQAAPPLLVLLAMDEAAFAIRFAGTPAQRLKRARMVRNACVAAGNWGDPVCAGPLMHLLEDPSAVVRGHAGWALSKVLAKAAMPYIQGALAKEPDPDAQTEFRRLIQELAG